MKSPSILCAGYMPLDIIDRPGGRVMRAAGGTASNVAAILSFLGWSATVAGQTGDDPAGEELLADLSRAGVNTDNILRAAGALSPRLVHAVRGDGHTYLYACRKCGRRFPRSRPLTLEQAAACVEALPQPTVFFFDRVNAATLWLAEFYADAGSIVMFEPSIDVSPDARTRALRAAHIVKHSDDRCVGGLDDVAPRPGQLRIITHGVNGLELLLGLDQRISLPALGSLVIDTGGAGDWTTAGFLLKAVDHGFLDEQRFAEAARFGQALAAVNCAVVGARGAMALKRDTVLQRVRLVLREGELRSRPRVARRPEAVATAGTCAICLMPLVDQSESPNGSVLGRCVH